MCQDEYSLKIQWKSYSSFFINHIAQMGTGGDNTPLAKRLMGQKVADAITLQDHTSNDYFMPLQINRFYWGPNTGVRTVNLRF